MKLYDHQLRIIDDDPKQTGFWLGTGSGKTRTSLMVARGEMLVICPKTQKEDGNWEREYQHLLDAGAAKSIQSLTTISKETFRRDHEQMQRYDTVIVDEAHTMLGLTPNTRQRKRVTIPKASQLFEALDEYLARTKPARLYLCTATIMKSPMTVLAAKWLLKGIKAIHPYNNCMGEFYQFRHNFYTKLPMPGREVWAPKKDSATKDALAAMVRDLGYVGRLEDFFDVPDQTFKTVYVPLSAAQISRIKELKMEYPEPIVRIGKRHQVENGCLAGDEFNRPELFSNAKIEKIKEYALEFPRMVIFARYRAQIDMLEAELTHDGYYVLTLTGDTKDRGQVIADANAAEECIFIAQCQVSAGWELPEYPVMIFASNDYSFVNRTQAEGRIQRANNIKKNLYVDLVVKGGVDDAVYNSLINKKDFDERIYTK